MDTVLMTHTSQCGHENAETRPLQDGSVKNGPYRAVSQSGLLQREEPVIGKIGDHFDRAGLEPMLDQDSVFYGMTYGSDTAAVCRTEPFLPEKHPVEETAVRTFELGGK